MPTLANASRKWAFFSPSFLFFSLFWLRKKWEK
jgi:hypothetical protein